MKIFISGPITSCGNIDSNREKFYEAAKLIKKNGHIPLNPAVLPGGMEHEEYMKICIAMLDVSDAIFQLPGWEESKGARQEKALAEKWGKLIATTKDPRGWYC